MFDSADDDSFETALGGPLPPMPHVPGAIVPPRRRKADPLNRAKPGQIGRHPAAAPKRDARGTFAPPAENEKRHRERVDTARMKLAHLFRTADNAQAEVGALLDELHNFDGGLAIAAAMGFDIEAAEKFLSALDATLDAAAPKTDA